MALKNSQYDRILRMYEERQSRNRYSLEQRRQALDRRLPQLSELDAKLAHCSVQWAKQSLSGQNTDPEQLLALQHSITKEKQKLLLDAGFPADYLEPHYDCRDCRDTGFQADGKKCHCFQQAVVDLLYEQSNLKESLQTENFAQFQFSYYSDDTPDKQTGQTPLANIKHVVAVARRFTEQFDAEYSNLLLYGNTGVGKTFLSNCIAKALLDSGHTVIYLTAYRLFELLERIRFGKQDDVTEAEARNAQLGYILSCDLLIIDDLGTEMSTYFTVTQLYNCLNERLLTHKPTVISTNLSLDQLRQNYSERIFSRLTSSYILLKIIGDDIRLKKLF